MSGWFDSFNQAVGFTEDPAEAAQKAAETQEKAFQLQKEQFEYQKELQRPFYEEGLPAYREMVSAITGKPSPTTGKAWTPETTPAFQWQQAEQEKALGRSLRALGRENSTFGQSARTRGTQSLLASEYDKQLGRLADLTNIARGGASSLAGASTGFSQQAGQQGAQQANAILGGSLLRQGNLYSGMQNLGGLAQLGLQAYQAYKKPSGGGGGGDYDFGGYGDMSDYSYDTEYYPELSD